MSKTIVQLKGVQKTYDGANLVVKDLNLNIREGEFVTMFDPLGSGKTTTLMMLAGFETATHGEIFLKENPLTGWHRKRATSAWCSRTMRCSRT